MWPRSCRWRWRRMRRPAWRWRRSRTFPRGNDDIEARRARHAADHVAAGAQEIDPVLPWRCLMTDDGTTALLPPITGTVAKTAVLRGDPRKRRAKTTALIAAASHRAREGADVPRDQHRARRPAGAIAEAARVMLAAIAADAAARRVGSGLSGGVRRGVDALVSPRSRRADPRPRCSALQRLRLGANALLD